MKTKLTTKISIIIILLITVSCGKDSPLNNNCNSVWTLEVSNELNAYSSALQAYSSDPTASNCSNVKSAAKNYLDSLRDVLDCVPNASQAQINQAINEAKAEVDDEACD